MYLYPKDFKQLIKTDNLNQIIDSDQSILDAVILAAESEAKSYLVQKYDVAREFSDTKLWSPLLAYKATDRVYVDASAYNNQATYSAGSLTLQNGIVYINTTAVDVAEAFSGAKWYPLGVQYQMFYVKLPWPEFNFKTGYTIGTKVWWKDSVYTALRESVYYSHDSQLQSNSNSTISNAEPSLSTSYWGVGVPYTIAAGTLLTDITKWQLGDNRNPQMVNYVVDIALYTVHSRISPRNIPDLRVKRYDDAIMWLKSIAKGDYITADITKKQPTSGNRIRYGGNVKQINHY